MSLIEHLNKPNWESVLRGSFEYALEVLRTDRFRSVGSAVDDLRGWLTAGGVQRVKEHLQHQMTMLQFAPEQQAAILACLDQLAQEHQAHLLELTMRGILPSPKQEWFATCGLTEGDVNDFVRRILAGERPFEDWMYAHGYVRKDVADVYQVLDQWLSAHGIIAPPPYDPNLN